jgi:tetratricopeptide (TPR) repeat protein
MKLVYLRAFFWICITLWSGAIYAVEPAKLHSEALKMARAGQLDQAIVQFEKLVADYPDNLPIFYDYLVVLNWANKNAEVLALLPKVDIEEVPAYVLETFAQAARSLRRFEQAIYFYQTAIRRFPKRAQHNKHQLALTFSRKGNQTKAIALFKELLATNPNELKYLYDYLVILNRANQQAQTLALLPKVNLEQAPAYVLESLSEAASHQKAFEKAIRINLIAVRRFPNRPINNYHLALALSRQSEALAISSKKDANEAIKLFSGILPPTPNYLVDLIENISFQQYNLALALSEKGEIETALALLKKMQALHPNDSSILHDYILLLGRTHQYSEIIKLLPKVNLEKTPASVLEILGTAARHQGHFKQALSIYQIAARRFPEIKTHQYHLALLLSRQGKVEQGIRLLKQIQATKAAYILDSLAEAARQQQRFDTAVEIYRIAVRSFPQRFSSQQSLAVALSEAGQHDKALPLFEKLLKKQPKNFRLFNDYLVALNRAEQYSKMMQWLPTIDLEQAPLELLEMLSAAAFHLQMFDQTIRIDRIAVRRFPEQLSNRYFLAFLLLDRAVQSAATSRRDNDKAMALFETMLSKSNNFLGKVLAGNKNNLDEILALLEKVLAAHPNNMKIFYNYLGILSELKQDTKLIALLPKVNLKKAPVYLLEKIAEAARRLKLYPQAVKLYKVALHRYPKRLSSKHGLALALSEWGYNDDAIVLFEQMLKAHPKNLNIFYDYLAVLNRGSYYGKVIKLSPKVNLEIAPAYAIETLSDAANQIQRFDLTVKFGKILVRRFPERLQNWYKLALALNRIGKPEEALTIFDKLLAVQPNNLNLFYDYLVILDRANHDDKVLDMLSKVNLEQAPAYVLETLGESAIQLQQFEQAEKIYKIAVRRFPKRWWNQHRLSSVLARQGKAEEALTLVEGLEAIHPNEPKLLYDYIIVLNRAEKYAKIMTTLPKLDLETAPEKILNILTESAIKVKKFEQATTIEKVLKRRFPVEK